MTLAIIGLILAAVLAVALCVALIMGIVELIATLHRIENLLERMEDLMNKGVAEKPSTDQRATGSDTATK